jgi:hypothetical protein
MCNYNIWEKLIRKNSLWYFLEYAKSLRRPGMKKEVLIIFWFEAQNSFAAWIEF